jgi:hypothetical protein
MWEGDVRGKGSPTTQMRAKHAGRRLGGSSAEEMAQEAEGGRRDSTQRVRYGLYVGNQWLHHSDMIGALRRPPKIEGGHFGLRIERQAYLLTRLQLFPSTSWPA